MTSTLATKVTEETKEALEELADAHGVSIYDVLQNSILTILRLCNKTMRLTQIMKEHWSQFEHFWGSQSIANITTIKQADLDIQDAIYRVTQKGKERSSLILMRRPFFDRADVSLDNNKILDIVLRTAFPSTYRMLDEIRQEHNLPNIMTAISWLISQHADGQMEREIAELFGDNERMDNGKSMPKQEMKRHNRRTMARYEQGQKVQQLNMFDQVAEAGPPAEDGG